MNTLRLHFCDFSSDFVPEDDFFFRLLSESYKIVLDPKTPDFLMYSCYGQEFLKYDCPRIYYTAENLRPDFNLCDYAIGFDYLEFGDRYLRFPNYARYGRQFESLVNRPAISAPEMEKRTGFCNFVYSNSFADPTRDRFFHLLSQYKRVDSPGRHLNNMQPTAGDRYAAAWRNSKVEFQRHYKFSIAFENSSAPGYTTEKIMHAFAAQTIPIYWGNPLITREFNPESFINCQDFPDFESVITRVAEIDGNDARYLAMVNQPCFHNDVIPPELTPGHLLTFLRHIFDQTPYGAFRRPRHGTTCLYEADMRLLAKAKADSLRRLKLRQFVTTPFRLIRKIAGKTNHK